MAEGIDERLAKLKKEFDKLFGKVEEEKDSLELLFNIGFTEEEALAWLEQEGISPNENTQDKKSNKDYTEPAKWFCNFYGCFRPL